MKTLNELIVYWTGIMDIRKDSYNAARALRDNVIYKSFQAGERQKDIAMYAGLSSSTVKHIIAAKKRGVK